MIKPWISKQFFIPLLVCLILSVADKSFGEAERLKVSMVAKYKGEKTKDSGDDSTETSESSWESATEVGTLTVTLKNSGTQQVKGKLLWCQVAESYSVKKKGDKDGDPVTAVAVVDPGNKEITLEPGASVTETITFKPLKSMITNESVENAKSGNIVDTEIINLNEYKGYIAVFTVDGKDVAVASNSARYKKPEWVNQCIKPPASSKGKGKGKGKGKK